MAPELYISTDLVSSSHVVPADTGDDQLIRIPCGGPGSFSRSVHPPLVLGSRLPLSAQSPGSPPELAVAEPSGTPAKRLEARRNGHCPKIVPTARRDNRN